VADVASEKVANAKNALLLEAAAEGMRDRRTSLPKGERRASISCSVTTCFGPNLGRPEIDTVDDDGPRLPSPSVSLTMHTPGPNVQ
jgi:hypothetical protein